MTWKLFEKRDVAGSKKIKNRIVVFFKPKLTYRIGYSIYITAKSKKGRFVNIEITEKQAKRLIKELKDQLRRIEKRKERNSMYALAELLKKLE